MRNFIFRLYVVCGGYAYYSTLTEYIEEAEHGREVRKVCPCGDFMPIALQNAGHKIIEITGQDDYLRWTRCYGWATVPTEVAFKHMSQWLRVRTCVKTHSGTYTDYTICSESTLKRTASRGKRDFVKERDGGRCLNCGDPFTEVNPATMQHIRPYSRGGDTTTNNLATLCNDCNQKFANQYTAELYEKIGLRHGVDESLLIKSRATDDNFLAMVNISDNMTNCRCEVW